MMREERVMPKKLGVAVVGFDHWYTAFPTAEAAKTMRDTRLVALADRSQARLKEVAAKYEPEYSTTDIGRVIADESVDVVCSLINTRDNVEVTKQALRAGKHVICVKPMAMNLRQVDQLIALAEKQQRVLWCFDQLGRTSVDPQVKAALKGAIGTPLVFYHVMAAGLPKSWPNNTNSGWWIDPELVPWGAWADHSIYTIDMLRALLDSDVVEAYGTIANRVHTGLGVEDHGLGVLRFDNGLTAVIEDSWTADGYWPHWTKIVGTKGVVHMDRVAFSEPVVIATAKGVKPAPARGAQKRSFLDVPLKLIRDGVTDPSPARESRRNMEIALAVYQASRTGRYQKL
jgi:predicted dehydrogenase